MAAGAVGVTGLAGASAYHRSARSASASRDSGLKTGRWALGAGDHAEGLEPRQAHGTCWLEEGASGEERTAVAAATREEVRVPLRHGVAHSRARPRFYRTGPCM